MGDHVTPGVWIALGMLALAYLTTIVAAAIRLGALTNKIENLSKTIEEIKDQQRKTEAVEAVKWDALNFKMGQLSRLLK